MPKQLTPEQKAAAKLIASDALGKLENYIIDLACAARGEANSLTASREALIASVFDIAETIANA